MYTAPPQQRAYSTMCVLPRQRQCKHFSRPCLFYHKTYCLPKCIVARVLSTVQIASVQQEPLMYVLQKASVRTYLPPFSCVGGYCLPHLASLALTRFASGSSLRTCTDLLRHSHTHMCAGCSCSWVKTRLLISFKYMTPTSFTRSFYPQIRYNTAVKSTIGKLRYIRSTANTAV